MISPFPIPPITISSFPYPPTPQTLQWLSAGQLVNRLQRSIRLWVLLHKLYGSDSPFATHLPNPFNYANLRDRLFASTHSPNENLSIQQLITPCINTRCLCQISLRSLVFSNEIHQTEVEWCQELAHLTGIHLNEIQSELQQRPFATVHRSLRDDLKFLRQQGWIKALSRGRYQCLPAHQWPSPPSGLLTSPILPQLSPSQTWDLLRGLEAIAFAQPNLEPIIQSLWEQTLDQSPHRRSDTAPLQRIFIDFDYILTDEVRDQVDTYQSQLEQLWRTADGGVIQFDYWMAQEQRSAIATVYPVCLHYARRAKYLSAYGLDPYDNIGWHNYRLDRIRSPRLKVLPWGDPAVPKALKTLWHTGQLPTPDEVREQLDETWGFNFYLPRALLILRFPPQFAQGYVANTQRHPTFKPIGYKQLPQWVKSAIADPSEQQAVLQILHQRSPQDAYYRAWIRVGDINVMMRLRDWRPNGEVIAPLTMRQTMLTEALQELRHYQSPNLDRRQD